MAVMRTTATVLVREIFRPSLSIRTLLSTVPTPLRFISRPISYTPIRCAAASDSDAASNKKPSARLSQVQQQLHEAMERAAGGDDPIPKITLDHVTVSFARSGGPGGQNVNKVNTKVDMRFNVKAAHWLSDRVREKILQMSYTIVSTPSYYPCMVLLSGKESNQQRWRTCDFLHKNQNTKVQFYSLSNQLYIFIIMFTEHCVKFCLFRGNVEDALEKLQAIIEAASYVPPPPSEEQVKKITKMAAVAEQKRLQNKKVLSQKKAFRRSRDSYD